MPPPPLRQGRRREGRAEQGASWRANMQRGAGGATRRRGASRAGACVPHWVLRPRPEQAAKLGDETRTLEVCLDADPLVRRDQRTCSVRCTRYPRQELPKNGAQAPPFAVGTSATRQVAPSPRRRSLHDVDAAESPAASRAEGCATLDEWHRSCLLARRTAPSENGKATVKSWRRVGSLDRDRPTAEEGSAGSRAGGYRSPTLWRSPSP